MTYFDDDSLPCTYRRSARKSMPFRGVCYGLLLSLPVWVGVAVLLDAWLP